MKTPNIFKKIDSRVIQALVLLALVGLFIYVLYYQYDQYSSYQAGKSVEDKEAVERPPLEVPGFFNFSLDNEANILQYMLFTFDKAKAKVPTPAASSATDAGSGNYSILGVVKRDRLFLLVRFNADNKIQLYGEGMSIDGNARVDRLSTDQVTIVDASGQQQTHKIFQTTYRVDASAAGKEKNPPRQPEPDKKTVETPKDERLKAPAREETVDEQAPPPGDDVPLDETVETIINKKEKKDKKDIKNKKNTEKQNDGS